MHRALALSLMLISAPASFAPTPRPAITGLAFVQFQVTDVDAASKFYGGYLGLPDSRECWGPSVTSCFSITPYQDVGILTSGQQRPELQSANNLLVTVGLWTNNAGSLRGYLLSRGLHPGDLSSPRKGWDQFEIFDPEGHRVVFLSLIGASPNPSDVRTQASHHMIHTGFVVRDRQAEDRLYKDVLGF